MRIGNCTGLVTLWAFSLGLHATPLKLDFLRPANSSVTCDHLLRVVETIQTFTADVEALSHPITRTVPGLGPVVFDRILGTSTARSLISADSSVVMKLYDPQYANILWRTVLIMGLREYFLLRYLGEVGLPASVPLAEPRMEENPFGSHPALVLYKYAVRGFSGRQIENALPGGKLKAVFTEAEMIRAADVGGDTMRRWMAMVDDPQFVRDFVGWLRQNPELLDPSSAEYYAPIFSATDAAKASNYVFDYQNWILIDP